MTTSESNSDVNEVGYTKFRKSIVTKCPHCNQTVTEHKQWLGLHLVKALVLFYHAFKREPGSPSQVVRQKSARGSFSKMKHFGLIERVGTDGQWRVTEWGENVVLGKGAAVRAAWTYQDHVVRVEERRDYISAIIKDFDYNRDMASQTVDFIQPKPESTHIQADMFEECV